MAASWAQWGTKDRRRSLTSRRGATRTSRRSTARTRLLRTAAHRGMPVVIAGRGNNEGFTAPKGVFIGARNLTATKARLLLMACLMRYGAPPAAADPTQPSESETRALRDKLAQYQAVFDTH